MTPGQRELRRARAYLSRVTESPAEALLELIDDVGAVRAARLVAAGQVPHRVAAATTARRGDDRAEADLSAIAAIGGRLVVPDDAEWPATAFSCFSAPAAHGDERWRSPVALWVTRKPLGRARSAGSGGGGGQGGHRVRGACGRRVRLWAR
ncbi:MAG: hypothetical protein JO287_18735 [Pseudonocardiales bacterium]|nr:hypothetical protein [Pseudonocardiales bacterium]